MFRRNGARLRRRMLLSPRIFRLIVVPHRCRRILRSLVVSIAIAIPSPAPPPSLPPLAPTPLRSASGTRISCLRRWNKWHMRWGE